jgi:uncharacterized protein (TIGR02996 family)
MARDLFEWLSDPEEGPLLARLQADPANRDVRARYTSWLLERGDPRGEFLLLAARLEGPDLSAAERAVARERHERLHGALDPVWLKMAQAPQPVKNCGSEEARAAPRRLRFLFECDQEWAQMQPTEDPGARFCEACRSRVFFCDDQARAEQHALRGECIVVSRSLVDMTRARFKDKHKHMTGRPDAIMDWAAELFSSG